MPTPHHQRMIRSGVASVILEPRSPMHGTRAAERMADDMSVIITRTGGVTENDLLTVGWTRTQVARHSAAAREIADKRATVDV